MISLGDFKTIYDAIKSSKSILGDSSRNRFNSAINSAISRVANRHFGLSYLDLIEFLNSNEISEFIEMNADSDELDLASLASILKKFINVDIDSSPENILNELLYEIKTDLLNDPRTRDIIISNDLEILKRRSDYYIDDKKIVSILNSYCKRKFTMICDEFWPYDIDEKSFVKIFEIAAGEVLDRTDKLSNVDCLPYINNLLSNGPVVCMGYYGMGKTTISKMLFKSWNQFDDGKYPIFLKLSHTNLEDHCSKSLVLQIILEIKNTLRYGDDQEYMNSLIWDNDKMEKEIAKFLNTGKIILIFDGIDESICSPQVILEFIKNLNSVCNSFFLTCRLEFNPFFDAFIILKNNYSNLYKNYVGVELLEWQKTQWVEYLKALSIQSPNRNAMIMDFCRKVCNGTYSNLPARPLFFKMLSDLEINNRTDVKIIPELDSNLAEIYYKFLHWKMMDDLIRKGCGLTDNLWLFKSESFKLIQDIAILEYRSTVGIDHTGVDIYKVKKICQDRKFAILSDALVAKILLSSSLFSIIKRSDQDEFMFSHKSFMEYLVAYSLAQCLIPEKGSSYEPYCDENWELFQTNEVVQHFVNEIERIRVTRLMSLEERDRLLSQAFEKVIKECTPGKLIDFDERTEGVLYYIGRLKVKSPELVNFLHKLADERKVCNEQYHRTANLALSMLISPNYCENYVLDLLNDYDIQGVRFKLNKERSLKYYGEAALKRFLKIHIDQYISKGCYGSIMPLKIFTYFTTIPLSEGEIKSERDYLHRILESAKDHRHHRIQEICERIDRILSKI